MYSVYGLKVQNSDEIRYIGITKKKPETRLKEHYHKLTSNIKANRPLTHKERWLLKNKGLIVVELIENEIITKKQVLEKEIQYIKIFKSLGARLVNSTIGGEGIFGLFISGMSGKKHTETTKEIIRQKAIGRKTTEEANIKRRAASLGKKHNKETKDLIRSLMKPEHLVKLSKIVLQFDLTNNFIKEYPSVLEASRITGISKYKIYKNAKGTTKPKTFIWKYK